MTVTEARLAALVAALSREPLTQEDVDTPLFGLGLDSLQLIKLAVAVEDAFGCAVPEDGVRDRMSIRKLAAWLDRMSGTKA